MGAYNGRLLPRLVFGLPLVAVFLTAAGFCCLVLTLLPSSELLILRPLFLLGGAWCFYRVRLIMRTGLLIVIIQALKQEEKLPQYSILRRQDK